MFLDGCNLIKTFSSTRRMIGVSGTQRPRGQFRSAHVMVLVWLVFWVNTALFPCCEALAAAFGSHSESVSQSVSAEQPAHHPDESDPRHSPESPCDYALNAEPAIIDGAFAALPTDRVQLGWFAIDTAIAPGLTAVNHAANRAPREYQPPPQSRLYLHTQRLLI